MFLESLKLSNFRNYEHADIKFDKNINIILGDNANGKTNILESIYVLALTKSHRYAGDNELVKYNEKEYGIKGELYKENLKNELKIFYKENKKEYYIDSNIIKKVNDYISTMNIILFCPDDIELIKSGPEIRRKYLNDEISQLYPMYYKINQDFSKILRVRNELLYKINKKEVVDMNYFNIVTDYFIEKSLFIYFARNKYLKKLKENSSKIYINLMQKKKFDINYVINFESDIEDKEKFKEDFKIKLKSNIKEEIKNGTTLFGPHRDNFEFILEGKNLKNYGSQGQQKMAVLVIKISEIELFYKQNYEYPILLLDDVFSEFDEIRRKKILKYIENKVQTIITTTDLENLKEMDISKYKIYHARNGKITEVQNGKK